MAKQTFYTVELEDLKMLSKFSERIARGKGDNPMFYKVCNNGSLKLGTIRVGAPMNHMAPSKDHKS